MILSARQVLDLAINAGFQGQAAIVATAVALAESSGETLAHNGKPPDDSYGLWQINMLGKLRLARLAQFSLASPEALYDPATNARVAFALYRGRGGNFGDWSTYGTGPNFGKGVYLNHMPKAQTAWVSRMAEQPNPVLVPPNPPAGSSPVPAVAGPMLPADTPSLEIPPKPAQTPSLASLPGPFWVRLLLWLLSRYKGGTDAAHS